MLEPYYKNNLVTLYHGDCLEVMPQLTEKFDCCITDPPYGTTACKWDSVIPFEPMWENLNRLVKDNGAVCLFAKEPFTSSLIVSNIKNFKYRWDWIKDKHSNFALSKYQPLNFIEDICVFNKHKYYPIMGKGEKNHSAGKGIRNKDNETTANTERVMVKTDGIKFPRNYLFFNRTMNQFHPTQKPVPLIEYLVKTYTNENELVLDFTCGSGTTGVACMRTNRRCVMIEQDEKYCEVAKQRLEQELKVKKASFF